VSDFEAIKTAAQEIAVNKLSRRNGSALAILLRHPILPGEREC